MKIVFVTTDSFIDHSYTIALVLRKKVNLQIFMLAKKKTEEIRNWCSELNAEFIERKRYRNPLSFISELRFIARLRKIHADKIWFNTINLYQVIIARLLLKNVIISVHDVEFHPASNDYSSLLSHKLTLLLFKHRICTTSRSQAAIFKSNYGIEPKTLQLPIINYYDRVSDYSVNREIGNTCQLFFFSSILPYKGIETLISAAEILISKNLKFALNIYGKIQYDAKEIKARILELRNTQLSDEYISYKDVHRIFCENDLLILPYRQVTQCGPLLIAYNTKTPVICTDLPGFREYVDDGKSGFLFDNSPDDLAIKIEFVLKNPRLIKELKEYIEQEISKKFLMHNLADKYIDIFKN